MATSTKNKSHEKEKSKTSSTPNQKPSPHYLKPTISFAMDICTYPCTKHTTNAPSDHDTTTAKHSSHFTRRSIDNKPLKKTLSISPKSTKPMLSSPPSRKGISPRSVPERGFKLPTAMRNGKDESSTKGASVKKNTNGITNGKEERSAKGVSIKKNANATARPKTGTKATTLTTNTAAATTTTTTTTSPKKKKLIKRKEGDTATPVKEIQDEMVEVVEEKTIQVESPPSQDQSGLNHRDSELKNVDSFDSTILSEEDELVTVCPKENNEETPETEGEVTEEPEQIINEQPEETTIQREPKVGEKEKEMVDEVTRETKRVTKGEPHKLKFRQAKQLDEKEQGDEANLRIKFQSRKESFEMKGEGKSKGEGKVESDNVVLKKQDVQEKKESPVSNDVIEETASKLVEKRKSKVKALVGAFETVMNVEHDTEE